MVAVVLQDSFDDLVGRKRIWRVAIARRPAPSGMKRIPRRTCVASLFRSVAVLTESKTNSCFRIPNGFESRNEVVLCGLLPSTTNDEESAIEVLNVQVCRCVDALRVIGGESRPELVALRPRCRCINRLRIGFADVDWRFRIPDCSVSTKGGSRVNRVHPGTIETRQSR